MPVPATLHVPSSDGAPLRRPSGAGRDLTASQLRTASSERRERHARQIDDISMSPRLFGYVFGFVSSLVSMISAVLFLVNRTTTEAVDEEAVRDYFSALNVTVPEAILELFAERIDEMNDTFTVYIGSGGDIVQQWKVYGCITVSGLLTLVTGFVVMAHYDSRFCVDNNRIRFRDGSNFERNLLLALVFLTLCAVFISTSKFSVGEAQANVFFSTWTNFVSCVMNYEVWRKGAGRNYTFQNILFGRGRSWLVLSILASIAFFSVADFFVLDGPQTNAFVGCAALNARNKWLWISGSCALASWCVVALQQHCQPRVVVRIAEAIVSLALIGVQGFVVAELSKGGLAKIPSPSNLYFSILGSFFSTIWIASSLLQENWPGK